MVVYYGWVDGPASLVQPVYSFLQRALLLAPAYTGCFSGGLVDQRRGG